MAKLDRRERVGLAVLITLLLSFAVILFFTVKRPTGPTYGFEDNVMIQQRLKNIEYNQ